MKTGLTRPTSVHYTEADSQKGPPPADPPTMHMLWRGIDAKLDSAQFHFDKAFEALAPPKLDAHMVAIEASGAIIGHEWQRHFFAHFDAFLSATRSVPEVIWTDFYIGDEPLYEGSKAYLEAAQDLRRAASEIAARIHSDKTVTDPPEPRRRASG